MVPGSTVHVLFSKISFWLAVTTFLSLIYSPAKRSFHLLAKSFHPQPQNIIIKLRKVNLRLRKNEKITNY